MLENKFKTQLCSKIKKRLPGSVVIHLDPTYIQGVPDLLILFEDKWAALEVKRSKNASRRPNQEYWVDKMNEMSYASFIFPENEEEILDELQQTLQP